MRSLPPAARACRRSFLASGGIALWNHFRPRLEQLEDRRMLACEVFVREQTLFIHGDENNNLVEILGTERGTQVTCDSQTETFQGVAAVNAQLGDGGDQLVLDNSDGMLGGIQFDIFGEAGDDEFTMVLDELLTSAQSVLAYYQGGAGMDSMLLTAGEQADRFDIRPNESGDAVEIDVTDMATGFQFAHLKSASAETLTTKGGDGDDEFLITPNAAVALQVFGQGGNDLMLYAFSVMEERGLSEPAIDGGDGDDKVVLVATDAPELIEILGVPDREVPDPLIRVTDLATGEVAAELSVVRAEAIAVDSRGGDDRVTMRDDQGPLANVNWKLITGPGNDEIDAVLQSNPNEFFVEAGLGNDDVSIRFVGIPQLPGPNEPLPVIDVDMGAGVDGLLLDVFGSRQLPPVDFAAAEIRPSVTLTEVLTSIFISGVGLLAMLTLFPLGSLEMAQSIRDDRAGHAKESSTNVAILLDGADLTADVKTGAAADEFFIDLAPLSESVIDLTIKTGADDDRVKVEYTGEAGQQSSLQVDAGAGNDEIHVHGSIDRAGPVVSQASYQLDVNAGIGDDTIQLSYSETVVAPNASIATEFNVAPGGGKDEVLVAFEHGGLQESMVIRTVWNSIAAEAQRDVSDEMARLTIAAAREAAKASLYSRMVGGDRRDEIQLAGLLTRSSGDIDIDVDWATGLGDDTVAVNLETAAEHVLQKVRIELGAGDDALFTSYSVSNRSLGGSRTRFVATDVAVVGGAGNDVLDVTVESAADQVEERLVIDSGPGDDGVTVLLRRLANPQLPNSSEPPPLDDVVLDVFTGVGNDNIKVRADVGAGLQKVRIDAGEGDNTIEAYYEATKAEIDEIDFYYQSEGSHTDSRPEYEYGHESRGGNDTVSIIYAAALGLDLALTADAGGGDDRVSISLQPPAVHSGTVNPPPSDDPHRPSAVPTRFWNAALATGAGHDDATLDAFFPVDPCRIVADIGMATGFGNDTVAVNIESALAELAQKVRIDTGAGDDRVAVNAPPVRRDGLTDLIAGADADEASGAGPHVKVFDGGTSAEVQSFDAYGPSFSGGVRVAAGDVNGDGIADIITAAGPGAGPHVKVFDGRSGAELRSFFAYGAGFTGGVYVAAGDVNNDGLADIITGAGSGSPGGHVKVFDGRSGAELRSFFAFDGFTGGVTVAAGDVNSDGISDIIVGAGPGAPGGHVKVFDGRSLAELASFFAYGGFSGGVFVAAGDVDGDGRADIVAGADAGAPGGHVKVFSGATSAEVRSFFAFDPNFRGGVRVAAGDVNGDGIADIVTGAGPGAPGGHVKVFDGTTGGEIRSFFPHDPSFAGGVFVAAGDLHNAALPKRLDLDLAIDTAGGADAVAVQLQAAATEEVIQKVQIATGDGADRASVIWRKLKLEAEFPREAADFSIDMGDGNDLAHVELQPDGGLDNIYSFKLQLGAGNDVARYWVFGTELPATPREPIAQAAGQLDLQVLGGQGSDDIAGRIGSDPVGGLLPLDLSRARIEIDGGAGRDRIALDFRGPILDGAAVDAVLRGGGGSDQVRARFDLGPASTGRLSAQVFGDAGNDELGLAILGEEQLDEFFALLDGGKGRDKCRVTKNVIVRNCEL